MYHSVLLGRQELNQHLFSRRLSAHSRHVQIRMSVCSNHGTGDCCTRRILQDYRFATSLILDSPTPICGSCVLLMQMFGLTRRAGVTLRGAAVRSLLAESGSHACIPARALCGASGTDFRSRQRQLQQRQLAKGKGSRSRSSMASVRWRNFCAFARMEAQSMMAAINHVTSLQVTVTEFKLHSRLCHFITSFW